MPLIPKYAEAERDIEERQRKVEQYIRQRDLNIVRIVPFSQGSWKGLDWSGLCGILATRFGILKGDPSSASARAMSTTCVCPSPKTCEGL